MEYNGSNGIIKIEKADGSFLLIGKTRINTLKHKDEGWYDIPRPEEIPAIGKVFPKKTDAAIRKLFHLLYFRALENKGDTKITNQTLADFLDVNVRTITRYIKALKDHKFIVTTERKHFKQNKYLEPTLTNGKKTFKTERVMRVWLAFAECGYSPVSSKKLMMSRDIRPDVSQALKKIPLKCKIIGTRTLMSKKTGKSYTLVQHFFSHLGIRAEKHIDDAIYGEMKGLLYLREEGIHEGLKYMGYTKNNYLFRKGRREGEVKRAIDRASGKKLPKWQKYVPIEERYAA